MKATPLNAILLNAIPLNTVPMNAIMNTNKIVNKFLLAGDKFMPEMHLKQTGFTYSGCRPFTKDKEIIQKFKDYSRYIYKNELDKTCFQRDVPHGDFKDLAKRTASDKVLRDEVFNIAKNSKYDEYEISLTSMVYKFFDKKPLVVVLLIKVNKISN